MKGEGESVPITIFMVFIFILAVVGIIVFVLYVGSIGQTECWRDTLAELRPVTGAFEVKTLAVGKLLGLKEFTIGLSLKSACVDRVIFDNGKNGLRECRKVCSGTERFSGDEQKCLEQCSYCEGSEGCIIAVPKTGTLGDIFKEGPVDYYKLLKGNIKVFNDVEFGLSPLTLVAPEEGSRIACLEFIKRGEYYDIFVRKEDAGSIKECKVTELGLA